jgi:hypothetical protein
VNQGIEHETVTKQTNREQCDDSHSGKILAAKSEIGGHDISMRSVALGAAGKEIVVPTLIDARRRLSRYVECEFSRDYFWNFLQGGARRNARQRSKWMRTVWFIALVFVMGALALRVDGHERIEELREGSGGRRAAIFN